MIYSIALVKNDEIIYCSLWLRFYVSCCSDEKGFFGWWFSCFIIVSFVSFLSFVTASNYISLEY